MKVHITNTGHPTINIPPANFEVELGNYTELLAEPGDRREQTRSLFVVFFSYMLAREKVFIRFEDECETCGVRGCPGGCKAD